MTKPDEDIVGIDPHILNKMLANKNTISKPSNLTRDSTSRLGGEECKVGLTFKNQ